MIDPELAWFVVGVAVLAIPVHGLIHRFEVAWPLVAALAALIAGGLLAAGPGLKPGWAMPVAGVAFVGALPISFGVGKALQAIRSLRHPGRVERSAGGGLNGRGGVPPVVPPDILPEQEPRP